MGDMIKAVIKSFWLESTGKIWVQYLGPGSAKRQSILQEQNN